MSTPPGWFPDPQQPGLVRWWDGNRWTEHAQGDPGQQAGWQATQPPAWAAQTPYGAPAASAWVTPGSTGQWGPQPQVYFAPGKRRGKRFWWTFGVLASIVILAAGGGIGFAIVHTVRQVLAPQHQAAAYLEDLTAGRYANAYARLCPVDTAAVSLTRFASAKSAAHPVSYRIYSTQVSTVNGVTTATVTFDETTSGGTDRSAQRVLLEHTSTGWYVCHRGVSPDDWAAAPTAQQVGPTLPAGYPLRNWPRDLVLSG